MVDEAALAESIESGHHRGAGFDVYATEPCTDSPLFKLPQVTVSPHLGASTVEAQDRAGTDVAESVLKALEGEFVPDAVNVSGGAVREEVAGWLDLARKLGLTAGRLLGQAPVAVEVEACGELSTEDVEVLGLSAVRGLFSGVTSEPVTFVNAMQIAHSRGVEVDVTTTADSKGHRSSLQVKVIGADGEISSLTGALIGIDGTEKFIRINGRGVDMRASGRNLFFRYADAPGALGTVGTKLGAAGINIVAAALTHGKQESDAVLILRVEAEVPEHLIAEINAALGAECEQLNMEA